MTDPTPNEHQRRLIEAHTGRYVVDAGAGTGKTYAITRRYGALLDRPGVEPADVMLVTFTNNAATEMKDRVVRHCDYSMAALRDAPITTFHAWCRQFLVEHGLDAPALLGIDDQITASTQLLEDEIVEADRFRTFMGRFIEAHPEHRDLVRVVRDQASLLALIRQLAAKGIFPTADGWYRNGEAHLDGDRSAFEARLAAANAPGEGNTGPTQSDLRGRLSGFERSNCLPPSAPSERALRGPRGTKQVDESYLLEAFEADRSALKAFVHDVYFEYLRFALRRNYLNFAFLQLFAFVLLCDDHDRRRASQCPFVMVDEFQDTSEIQFKLAMLLAGEGNLCVVGDWKQSIYGFNYAAVENIRSFEDRLQAYAAELNDDHERISYPVDDVTPLDLRRNYRSTAAILDQAEEALSLAATQTESVETPDFVRLEADTDREHSVIEAFQSETERDAILERILEIEGNERYAVEGADGELRPPTYDDVAVLTRTRDFGRELQSRASEVGLPMAYEGGVSLYETDHAILVLAWLRVLDDERSRRGWAVVLEEAGYTLDEIDHMFASMEVPEAFRAFRARLADHDRIGAVVRAVLERYGLDDAYGDALIAELEDADRTIAGTLGDLIDYVERCIEAGETVEVSASPGGDAVTVQTVHAAKGLEHPIVIVADVNRGRFPSTGGGFAPRIRYDDTIGLRQTTIYRDEEAHLFDNWRYRVLSPCLAGRYDEERRLLYVAMTRAEHHLLVSAGERPSQFFEGLSLEPTTVEPDLEAVDVTTPSQSHLEVAVPTHDIPLEQTPHSLMDDAVFEDVAEGRGMAFGNEVHDFAERYATGRADLPADAGPDKRHVAALLDGLAGEVAAEVPAHLPVPTPDGRVTVSGVIDLLHHHDDHVEVIDYKTDLTDHAQREYRKQLSIYYHVVTGVYPDAAVVPKLLYTNDDRLVEVEPLSMAAVRDLVSAAVDRDSA